MNPNLSAAPGAQIRPGQAQRPLRIILLQLPVPDGSGTDIPLAAACLENAWRRWLPAIGLDEAVDPCRFIKAPGGLANHGSDPALLDWIVSQSPDILGFSLYLWNSERSAWLAARARARCPDLRCLAGGPEVQTNRLPPAHHHKPTTPITVSGADFPDFDWLIAGPGEEPFVELLAGLTGLGGGATVPAGRGAPLFLPRRQALAASAAAVAEAITNHGTAAASHPWLDGSLLLGPDHPIYLETVRGCPNKCSYCFYGKQFKRMLFLPEHLVEAIIRQAVAAGSPELYLMDPSFSQRPALEDFLEKLARWNANGQLVVHTELRLEDITPRRARLLAAAGVRSVEAGLQSTNPKALAAVGRHWDRQAFERGARLLLDAGIRISTGVIIGLPHDSPTEIRQTIDYVAALGLGSGAEAYPLAVLPGTTLREQANQLGLEYLDRPPYYLLSSPWLDQTGIVDAIAYADETWEREGLAPITPDPLTAYALADAAAAERLLARGAALPRVVNLRLPASLLADAAARNRLLRAGRAWRADSPSSECRLLVELDCLPSPASLEELRGAFLAEGHLLERVRYFHPDPQGTWSCRIFALLSAPELIEPWIAGGLDDHADLVIDLVAARNRAGLAAGLLATDWDQIPFVRTGHLSFPELGAFYAGMENLILD